MDIPYKFHQNKGYFVGSFTEKDLKNKQDKIEIQKAMKITNCKYINSFKGKKNKKDVLHIYVCDKDLFSHI